LEESRNYKEALWADKQGWIEKKAGFLSYESKSRLESNKPIGGIK
jgi:hypothetical protein